MLECLQTLTWEASMATYVLLCNFTDQGIRAVKDSPKRRAAARELGKKFGVELKAGYLAMGTCDLILTVATSVRTSGSRKPKRMESRRSLPACLRAMAWPISFIR